MNWTGITISVADDEGEEAVIQMLLNSGCAGVALNLNGPTKSVTSYLPNDDLVHDRLKQIEAALMMLPTLGIEGVGQAQTSKVDEEDWANAWKAYFKPLRIGRRIVVSPPWEEPLLQDRDILITIDPGMAFGTGTHATTQLCLTLLEEYVRSGESLADIGTGSGILAICGSKLGADKVVAVDNDPLAVRIAAENAVVNSASIDVSSSFPSGQQFNVVVANIIADTLIAMADELAAITAPNGILIMSGIIDGRQDDVRLFTEGSGFTSLETRTQGEWVALVFRREVN